MKTMKKQAKDNAAYIKIIASRLKHIRLYFCRTQIEMADMLGVTPQQYQKYENGTNRLRFDCILALAHKLHINIFEYFIDLVPKSKVGTKINQCAYLRLTNEQVDFIKTMEEEK